MENKKLLINEIIKYHSAIPRYWFEVVYDVLYHEKDARIHDGVCVYYCALYFCGSKKIENLSFKDYCYYMNKLPMPPIADILRVKTLLQHYIEELN